MEGSDFSLLEGSLCAPGKRSADMGRYIQATRAYGDYVDSGPQNQFGDYVDIPQYLGNCDDPRYVGTAGGLGGVLEIPLLGLKLPIPDIPGFPASPLPKGIPSTGVKVSSTPKTPVQTMIPPGWVDPSLMTAASSGTGRKVLVVGGLAAVALGVLALITRKKKRR